MFTMAMLMIMMMRMMKMMMQLLTLRILGGYVPTDSPNWTKLFSFDTCFTQLGSKIHDHFQYFKW